MWLLWRLPTAAWYNGGNTVVAGDTVRETSGTVYGVVMQVTTASGTWAAGTAAGTIVLMTTQTWTASQYFDDLVAGANSAYITAITSTDHDCEPDRHPLVGVLLGQLISYRTDPDQHPESGDDPSGIVPGGRSDRAGP